MTTTQTILFVCLHGAGMSRMAAAYFNHAAPHDWHAVSAGLEPAEYLSSTAASLLAGTDAEAFLDHSAPRPVASAGEPLRDEIRERAEALAKSIVPQ